MKSLSWSLLVASIIVGGLDGRAHASPVPAGWLAQNIKPIGYIDTEHRWAYKLAVKHKGDRWYIYTAYAAEESDTGKPGALVAIDVTDPSNPKRVFEKASPGKSDAGQVTLHGDTLITNLSARITREMTSHVGPEEAWKPHPANADYQEGILIWNIEDPAHPRQVGSWQSGAFGTHRNSYPGGKYAFLSATRVGDRGFSLVILDVSDPSHPVEVSSWHQYGQKQGETIPEGQVVPSFHGPATLSPDGKTLIMGYTPDVITLDISNIKNPKVVGRLPLASTFAYTGISSVHTGLPIWDRKLIYVSGEQKFEQCKGPISVHGLVDDSDPAKPFLLSVLPTPTPPAKLKIHDFCERAGRFGPHNISTEIHNPDVAPTGKSIYVAYFNAGLQTFDISDPRLPKNTGYFIPADSEQPERSQTGLHKEFIAQDTLTDARGYIYLLGSGGLYILKDTTK